MIFIASQRANGRDLARHLSNVADNDHVVLHELSGFVADTLFGAFKEARELSYDTKCRQYLFSVSLNPPQTANLPVKEFERVIDEVERRLGLAGQPRAVVFHEKKGRQGHRRHAHCVWSRIDTANMKAINLPHFKRRLMDISRELFREYGWEMPAGLREAKDRDPLNYSHTEAGQAKRVKRDTQALKDFFKSCWAASDSRAAFAAALSERDFRLARGDQRGFVAVGAQGEAYSLSRWCDVKPKELRERLGDNSDLPSVEDAVALLGRNARPRSQPEASAQDTQQYKRLLALDKKRADLVARQRKERDALPDSQEARRTEEIKARRSRMPTGIRATWARLTGHHQRLLDQLASEARACEVRDGRETQALVDRHLAERRELDRERAFVEAQVALEREARGGTASTKGRVYQPDPLQPLILPREDTPFTRGEIKRQPDLVLAHLSDKRARFRRADILRELAKFIDDPLDLRVAADRALASPELVRLSGDGKDLFTTREFQTVERQLSGCAADMARSGGFRVDAKHIKQSIDKENVKLDVRFGSRLSEEQVTAIEHILAPNQLRSVVGLAGSGKSTLLSVALEAWERQGIKVHGATLAGKAADSLQAASGIASRTLASLEASWKSGYEPIGTGDVVVIDEAGMVGTRQLARVAEQLQVRGCKLVLIGDPDQLQPIQAGTPFRVIVDKTGAVRLTEIRRQKADWQRKASRDLAEGQVDLALQSYAEHRAVHKTFDRDQAITSLVDDYMADWKANGSARSRLALAHRRMDVYAINQAIKKAQASGIKPTIETLFDTEHGPRAFATGDRILFTRNDATLGVRNGMLGTVQAIGDRQMTVRFDPDDVGNCRQLTFAPKHYPSFDHGFAVSIHRSQGYTVERSFVLSSQTLDRNLAYVALTRHREETGFYTAPDIAPKRMGLEQRMSAADRLRKRTPERTR